MYSSYLSCIRIIHGRIKKWRSYTTGSFSPNAPHKPFTGAACLQPFAVSIDQPRGLYVETNTLIQGRFLGLGGMQCNVSSLRIGRCFVRSWFAVYAGL
jgi:hypothetical protein